MSGPPPLPQADLGGHYTPPGVTAAPGRPPGCPGCPPGPPLPPHLPQGPSAVLTPGRPRGHCACAGGCASWAGRATADALLIGESPAKDGGGGKKEGEASLIGRSALVMRGDWWGGRGRVRRADGSGSAGSWRRHAVAVLARSLPLLQGFPSLWSFASGFWSSSGHGCRKVSQLERPRYLDSLQCPALPLAGSAPASTPQARHSPWRRASGVFPPPY